jgi:hypothetical protein
MNYKFKEFLEQFGYKEQPTYAPRLPEIELKSFYKTIDYLTAFKM